MKNNIIFTIVAGLLLSSCFSPTNFIKSLNVANLAPDGMLFWKKDTTPAATEKELYACRKIAGTKRGVYDKSRESFDEFIARDRNYTNDCMLERGFIYMDKGVNNKYDSRCEVKKPILQQLIKVCQQNK